jgi:mono/diheme cytochrome c family protein
MRTGWPTGHDRRAARWRTAALLGLGATAIAASGSASRVGAQHQQHHSPATPPAAAPAPHQHGTPAGWTFRWPKGDPARGREVFVKLECYSCHEVRGEPFPLPTDRKAVGPELSQMGPLHEPEYFAEAIIHPNATIERGQGYEAPDGSSKMPSYNDSVTVQEVVDLVAYLAALKPAASAPAGGHKH